MKAILVIDMPTDCEDCQFGYDYRCFITWKRFEEKEENYIITYPIPTWCPLKPLPQKKKLADYLPYENYSQQTRFMDFINGWNACIREIENEQNDS